MPPEQARGEKVDARSDVYAIGVVLYELITGTLPFVANTSTETILKQIAEEPARPSLRRTGVDPRLEEICLRALRKRPEDRYQTARQMRTALGVASGTHTSSDEPPPLTESPPPPISAKPEPGTRVPLRATPTQAQAPTVVTRDIGATGGRTRTAYAVGVVLVVAAGVAVVARMGTPHGPTTALAPEETASAPTSVAPDDPHNAHRRALHRRRHERFPPRSPPARRGPIHPSSRRPPVPRRPMRRCLRSLRSRRSVTLRRK